MPHDVAFTERVGILAHYFELFSHLEAWVFRKARAEEHDMRGVLDKVHNRIDDPVVKQIFGLYELGVERKRLDSESIAVERGGIRLFELRKPREAKLMGKPDDCIGSDEEPFSNALKRDIVNIITQLDDVAHDLAFEIVELALASSHMIIKRFLIFHKMFQPLAPRRTYGTALCSQVRNR